MRSTPVSCGRCHTLLPPESSFCFRCGRQQSEAVCGRCWGRLHPEARYCHRCGASALGPAPPTAESEPHLTEWSDERKLATVVFADIAGFTELAGGLEPDAVWELANAVFEPLASEVESRGGTVVKYIGDAIMAVFGVPAASEDDPLRALDAALAMRERLEGSMPELRERWGQDIAIRIGVNTGLVMVGAVGVGRAARRDVMGTAVNLANRMQTVAGPQEIVVGPATRRLARDHFELAALEPVSLKGLPGPLQVFSLEGRLEVAAEGTRASPLEMLPDLRDAEVEVLQNVFELVVRRGRLRAVKLIGDSGMGKELVLRRLQRSFAVDGREPVELRAAGHVGATPTVSPLGLLARLVRSRFSVRADEPPREARERVIAGVAAAWGPLEEQEGVEAARVLADLAALRAPEQSSGSTDGSFTLDAVSNTLVEWIARLAAARPVVLLVRDLHWADDASLEILEGLVRALVDHPVFVVASAEPGLDERRPSYLEAGLPTERLELLPLSDEAMQVLVDDLLRRLPAVPVELREQLVARAEGNPGYANEMVRLLIDQGAITTSETGWAVDAAALGSLSLPETVQGVLQARLDSLAHEEKEVLKRAAVIGRVFWEGAVVTIADAAIRPQVARLLSALEQRRFLRRRHPSAVEGDNEYAFQSQALRDIAYRSIPGAVCRRAHLEVAAWLRERGELWDGGYAELAGHLEAGGAPEDARQPYVFAARHATAVFANEDAIAFYERALGVWPPEVDLEERVAVWREHAMTLARVGRFDDALTALDEADTDARALAREAQPSARAWVDLDRSKVLKEMGRTPESLASLDRGLGRIASRGPSTLRMLLLSERAYHRATGRDTEGAREDCQLALETGQQVTDRDSEWRTAMFFVANARGIVHLFDGDNDEAERCFLDARHLSRQVVNQRGRWAALVNLGAIAFHRREAGDAVAYFREALAIARRTSWVKDRALCHNNLGQALHLAGSLGEATVELEEAQHLARTADLLDVLADSTRALAAVRLETGARSVALREALGAVEHARRAGAPRFEALAHGVAMDCYLAAGAEGDARTRAHEHLDAALAVLATVGGPAAEAEMAALRARFPGA